MDPRLPSLMAKMSALANFGHEDLNIVIHCDCHVLGMFGHFGVNFVLDGHVIAINYCILASTGSIQDDLEDWCKQNRVTVLYDCPMSYIYNNMNI